MRAHRLTVAVLLLGPAVACGPTEPEEPENSVAGRWEYVATGSYELYENACNDGFCVANPTFSCFADGTLDLTHSGTTVGGTYEELEPTCTCQSGCLVEVKTETDEEITERAGALAGLLTDGRVVNGRAEARDVSFDLSGSDWRNIGLIEVDGAGMAVRMRGVATVVTPEREIEFEWTAERAES